MNFQHVKFQYFPGLQTELLRPSPFTTYVCVIRYLGCVFQTVPLSHFHCCTAFEGPDLTTKPTVVVSTKLQPLKSKDCINLCFYLSKLPK